MAGTGPHGLCLPFQALPLPAGLPLCPGLLLEGPDLPGQGPGQDGGPGPRHPGLPHPGTGSDGFWEGVLCPPAHWDHHGYDGSSVASVHPFSPQAANWIPVQRWWGDPRDEELLHLTPLLGQLGWVVRTEEGGWRGDGHPGLLGQGSVSCPGPPLWAQPPPHRHLSPCRMMCAPRSSVSSRTAGCPLRTKGSPDGGERDGEDPSEGPARLALP